MATLLAAGLRARGHEAVEFETGLPPSGVPWWRTWRWHQRRVEGFVTRQARFDALDMPAILAGRAVARNAPLIVRSVQPELRYLGVEVEGHLRRGIHNPLRAAASILYAARIALAVVQAWRRARLVLCLGTPEHEWMARRWPALRPRLRCYFSAPPPEEQAAFRRIRSTRGMGGPGSRWLWVGRWVDHKGTGPLLSLVRNRLQRHAGEQFTIAGCGASGEVAVRREFGDEPRIALRPFFDRTELRDLLLEHDRGLSTSLAEGWGLNLQEMLEAGLTVHATREGAFADLVPFFPETLWPLPPSAQLEPLGCVDEERMPDYYSRFSQAAVTQSYEEAVGTALGRRG